MEMFQLMMVRYNLLVVQRILVGLESWLVVVCEKMDGINDLGLSLGGDRACLLDRDQMMRFSRDGSSKGGWSDGFRLLGEEKTCSQVRWLSAVVAVEDGCRRSIS